MEQFGNVGQFQTDFHKQSLFTSDPRLSVSLLNSLPKLIQFYEEGMGLIWILGSVQQSLLSLTLDWTIVMAMSVPTKNWLGCFLVFVFF